MNVGDKVQYMGANNDQVRWGSNDDPRGLLSEGAVYTVHVVDVHRYHTKISLVEFPDKVFNSASFQGAT